jgi:cysteine synthase A
MESLNPGGSGKDRAALYMIEKAETLGYLPRKDRDGIHPVASSQLLNSPLSIKNGSKQDEALFDAIRRAMKHSITGGLVIEGTSGSTGISLATLCAARGHACLVVMPDDQGPEKQRILQTLGASVVVVPTASISNPQHYVNVARRLAKLARQQSIPAVFIDQFENLANYQTHYERTGREIYNECPEIDAFVMSSGTGGTIAGVASYLKQQKSSCRIVLVDPPGSSLYHAVQHGITYAPQQRERALKRHRYDTIAEGIGLDRMTENLSQGLDNIDAAVRVSDQEAVDMAHWILRSEGLWVGSSSAMNLVGAIRTATMMSPGSTVVTVVCDAGQRHVTRFWNRDFCLDWGLEWPGDQNDGRLPQCLKQMVSNPENLTYPKG